MGDTREWPKCEINNENIPLTMAFPGSPNIKLELESREHTIQRTGIMGAWRRGRHLDAPSISSAFKLGPSRFFGSGIPSR